MTRSWGNSKARAIWSAGVLARIVKSSPRCERGRPSKCSFGARNNSRYQAEEQAEYPILWRKRPKKIEPAAPKFGA